MFSDVIEKKELVLPPDGPPYSESTIYDIPLSDIYADENFNCRGFIEAIDVEDLARDIKQKGLIQPILVQPWDKIPGKKFRIVAGYRRYKATRINAADKDQPQTIKAIVSRPDLDDLDARVLNLSENVQRKMLNMKQEAHAIEHFKLAEWSEQSVATQLKVSRGWVQVRFMLLDLPDEIQDEAAAGLFTNLQIRDMYKLTSREQQFEFAKKIKDGKLKGNKREVKVAAIMERNAKRPRLESEIFEMQDILIEYFGHSLATKALAWAGGAITDKDMHNYIAAQAGQNGKFYPVPVFGNAAPAGPNLEDL